MAQRVRTDWVLFWVVIVLVCFGLVMVYSASSVVAQQKFGSSLYYIYRQLAWAAVGFAAMMALQWVLVWKYLPSNMKFCPTKWTEPIT